LSSSSYNASAAIGIRQNVKEIRANVFFCFCHVLKFSSVFFEFGTFLTRYNYVVSVYNIRRVICNGQCVCRSRMYCG